MKTALMTLYRHVVDNDTDLTSFIKYFSHLSEHYSHYLYRGVSIDNIEDISIIPAGTSWTYSLSTAREFAEMNSESSEEGYRQILKVSELTGISTLKALNSISKSERLDNEEAYDKMLTYIYDEDEIIALNPLMIKENVLEDLYLLEEIDSKGDACD